MKTWVNYFNMIIFRLLPETSCFALKRSLFRFAGAKIGKNVRICSSVHIMGCGELIIGDDVWIGHEVFISTTSRVEIGNYVDIAPMVYIGTGTHRIDAKGLHSAGEGISENIKIEDGAWLCARSTLLPGVVIGKNSVVAAGAVVTKPFPFSRVLIGGIPASEIKKI